MIPLQQFAFASSGGTSDIITLTNQSVSRVSLSGAAYAEYQVDADGSIYKRESATFATPTTLVEQWCSPSSSAGNYEVRATLQAGDALSIGTMNTWLALTSDRLWYNTVPNGTPNQRDSTVLFEIRNAVSQLTVASATITIYAEVA